MTSFNLNKHEVLTLLAHQKIEVEVMCGCYVEVQKGNDLIGQNLVYVTSLVMTRTIRTSISTNMYTLCNS